MIVEVDAGGALDLADKENFGGFCLSAPQGISTDDLRQYLEPAGVVRDSYAWIDGDWLRAQGPASSEWHDQLSAMIRYADAKGWLDPAGRIRAHIEYVGA